jgi:hypothetical protein
VTASEVRVPHARLLVAVGVLATCAVILWLARSYTFYFDEWDFIISAPTWNAESYLQPHNLHPVMVPRLIYSAMLSTIGLRSYLPYMAVLLALHGTSALLLFELVRRRTGDVIGIACAAILLVLGAGWENLLWAFQISFVGSVACGLGMLLALDARPTGFPARGEGGPQGRMGTLNEEQPWRMPLATALLTASLMFSAIGLFFGVAAAVRLALTNDRRRDLAWLAPVAVVFGAWFLAFGRFGEPAPPLSAADLLAVPLYALWGLGASAAGLIGASGVAGPPLLLLAAGAVGYGWWRGGFDPLSIGVAAGLVTFYLVTGVSRAQLGYQQSGAGRYVYEGAVFWLILLADAARRLPWRGTWRPALVACLFLACFNSGVLLFTYAAGKTVQMQRQVADLQALAAQRGDPCLNPNGAVDLLVMPQVRIPALYYRAVDRYGDPVASLPVVDQADFDRARANLPTPGCK